MWVAQATQPAAVAPASRMSTASDSSVKRSTGRCRMSAGLREAAIVSSPDIVCGYLDTQCNVLYAKSNVPAC
jgi:hypothetical protein